MSVRHPGSRARGAKVRCQFLLLLHVFRSSLLIEGELRVGCGPGHTHAWRACGHRPVLEEARIRAT